MTSRAQRIFAALALIAVATPFPAEAQESDESEGEEEVRIIRRLPESGENTTSATWTRPHVTPEQLFEEEEAPGTRLTGRLALGGTGGLDAGGTAQLGVAADSGLTLLQRLGQGAALELEGEGRRNIALQQQRERYGGGIRFTGEALEIDATGRYERALTEEEELDKETEGYGAALELEMAYLETLPITVAASYDSRFAAEDSTRVAALEEFRGTVAADGTVGAAELASSVNAVHVLDDENDYETTNLAAEAAVTLPLADRFALKPGIASDYSQTDYEQSGASLESVGLDGSLGLLFPLTDALSLRFVPAARNAWSTQSGSVPEEDKLPAHALTVSALAGADYADEAGRSGSSEYELSRTVAGGLTQRARAAAEWQAPEEQRRVLDSAATRASLLFVDDRAGAALSREHSWSASLGVKPAEALELSGGYDGSYRFEEGSVTTHGGRLSYRHTPVDAFSYGSGAELTMKLRSQLADELEQRYSGELELSPRIGDGRPTLQLAEELSIVHEGGAQEQLSSFSPTLAVPIGRAVQLRYAFGWEWYRPEEAGEENSYSHSAGGTLGAGPVSTSLEYRFSHGAEPDRHDLSAGLQARFGEEFSVESSFEWSRYREDGEWKQPFLGTILLARSF